MLRRGLLASAGMALALASLAAPAHAGSKAAGKGTVARKSVVGGTLAAPGSFPSTVTVLLGKTGLCTGSVVAPTTVVTAGYCVIDTPASKMTIRAGSVSSFAGGETIPVSAAIAHPAFTLNWKTGIVNDIAVLKLASPTTAPPIALANPAEDLLLSGPGATMTAAGFGKSNPAAYGKTRIGRLRSTPVFPRAGCRGGGAYRGFSAATMICASGSAYLTARSGTSKRDVQRATCFGDSGGPVLADTPLGPRLLGVTSYGGIYPRKFEFVACGLKGYPDVYTRVSAYLGFVAPYL